MKKLIALVVLTLSFSANAQHHHHGYHVGGYGVWPLVIGGTIGYIAAREMNRPVVVQQPVVIQQPPVVYNNSTPVYNLPNPPYAGATPIYEKRTQYDNNCNCYVVVYNQIGWQ